MAVNHTLREGLDQTAYTHKNPFVDSVHNERQFQRHITYNANGITYKDEWIGTSDYINELVDSILSGSIETYNWTEGEALVVDGLKGDLYKLTHTYFDEISQQDEPDEDDPDEPGSVSDSIEDSVGINPWSITSETTDIGAIDYYILKFKISESNQDKIKRNRIAQWEQSPYEQKIEKKYNTLHGYITVDKNPEGIVDSPITLDVVEWIIAQKRQQFPLTSVRIRHEYIVNGPSYKKGVINKTSLAKELAKGNTPLQFPSQEFGAELKAIPDCPYSFDFSYDVRFMLTDWNIQIHDPTGKYLVTKEYISYPALFPAPLDPTPGD